MNKDLICLAIETSCDETSAAVTCGRKVLSNVISSQIELHKVYGGVVPEIASRHHVENISVVIEQALCDAGVEFSNIDFIATTYGPGLVGALLVGLSTAKAIAFALEKPLVGVHHITGHISANYIENEWLEPPFICLVVSGGHTEIVHVKTYTDYKVLGQTRDDAAGEAFDKIARAMGLGYPGGPCIDKAASCGRDDAYLFPRVRFPNCLDFSFSGLKTAVLNHMNKIKMAGEQIIIPDLAASFQRAVVDILVENTISAVEQTGINKIALAGGVAANSLLRKTFVEQTQIKGIKFSCPPPILCTDNAAMIGCSAYYRYISGYTSTLDLNAVPGLKL
ncbi:MAG: tRNA (adenosine(37)-N6)-threonylcarbamoyltransferase complex transferase subunit TsaD [Deltaproteobacteria bacterium]